MLSSLLPWILAVAVLVVLPVALMLWADDHPRSDDPPDSDEEPVTVLLAA